MKVQPTGAYIDCQHHMPHRAFVPVSVGFSPLAARALGGLVPLVAALCPGCCPAPGHSAAGRGRQAPFSAALRLPPKGAEPVRPEAAEPEPQTPPETAGAAAPLAAVADTQAPAPLPEGAGDAAPLALETETEPELSETMNAIDLFAPPPEAPLPQPAGLLRYKKWWFLRHVDVHVGGELLEGTPIFIEDGTMRLVNDRYSYFIPMDKIDYIRTRDGLEAGNAPAK